MRKIPQRASYPDNIGEKVSFVEVRIPIQLSPLCQVMKPSFRKFLRQYWQLGYFGEKRYVQITQELIEIAKIPRVVPFFDHQTTLPKTNIFAPENGWLEYYCSFLLGFGLFSGANLLLVSGMFTNRRTGVNIVNRGCLILPKTVQLGEVHFSMKNWVPEGNFDGWPVFEGPFWVGFF